MKPTSKFGRLVRLLLFTAKSSMAQTRSRLFKGSPAFSKWNLVRVLAMGVMMSVGVAMYFNMIPEGVAVAPTAVQNLEATSSDDSARYLRSLNNDAEWRFGPTYIEDFPPESVRPLSKEALAVYQRDDDEWLYRSPFRRQWRDDGAARTTEDMHPGQRSASDESVLVGHFWIYPDDEFTFNPPYYQVLKAGARTGLGLDRQLRIFPDDEWVYGPPYIKIFPQP